MKTLREVFGEHTRLGISGFYDEDSIDYAALFDERVKMRRAEDKLRDAAAAALARWRPNKVPNTPLSALSGKTPQGCMIAALLMAGYKIARCDDGTVKVGIRKSDLAHSKVSQISST